MKRILETLGKGAMGNGLGRCADQRATRVRGETTPAGKDGVLIGRDIICFANDWQADPLSKKHLMLRFARQNRILWVNSLHNRRPRLARKDARRVAQKLREFFRGTTAVYPNIWQVTPLYLPFLGWLGVRRLNRLLLRCQLRYALWRLGFGERITWTFVPTSADVAGTLGENLVVYHCVDEYSAFSDAAAEIAAAEQILLRKADLVLASSEALLEKKRVFNPQTFLLLHGVDYEHFRLALEDSTPLAPELLSLPRPILGFHGLIADWVDLPLVAEIARQQPGWSVVLVGRADTDLTPLQGLSNVHLIGHRPYSQLPSYLKGFDVAILPFVFNELTRNANPLKLREYLAAGLPVVAAPLPEVMRFDGRVAIAATPEQYIHHVQTLLNRGVMGPSRERSEQLVGESWDHRMTEIERLLSAALPLKAHRRAVSARRASKST